MDIFNSKCIRCNKKADLYDSDNKAKDAIDLCEQCETLLRSNKKLIVVNQLDMQVLELPYKLLTTAVKVYKPIIVCSDVVFSKFKVLASQIS